MRQGPGSCEVLRTCVWFFDSWVNIMFAEENGEQHGNFGPEGHYEEPPPSEGLPHGAPGGMHGEPFEGEHEGFEGREEPGFEGHPEFEGHEGHEGHREEYEGREEPAFQGHQEEFEGHQLPEEGQEVPPHFQHPPGQWEESQDEPQHDGAKFPGHGSPDEFAENAGETEHGPFEGPGKIGKMGMCSGVVVCVCLSYFEL